LEFFPRSSEFVAVNVAPPAPVIQKNAHHSKDTVPDATLKMCADELVFVISNAIGLDDVPVSVGAFDMVVVVAPGKNSVLPAATDQLEKVFAPAKATAPREVLADIVRVPKVLPPPLNVRVKALVALRVKLAAKSDVGSRLVTVPTSKTTVFAEVPPVNVKVPVPSRNFRAPVPDRFKPVEFADVNVILIGAFAAKSSVPVNAPATRVAKDVPLLSAATVTVPLPELASKITLSPVVGTDWPPAPPDVPAQCVVSEASHVPVPPTQKRFAISYTLLLKPRRVTVTVVAAAEGSAQTAVAALKPSGTGKLQTTPEVLAGTGSVAFTEPAAPSLRSTVTAVAELLAMMTLVM
jgi:hypothetical protein